MDKQSNGPQSPQPPGGPEQPPQPPPYQPPSAPYQPPQPPPYQPPAQPYQPPQAPYQPPQAPYQPPAGQYPPPAQPYQQQPGGYQQVPPPPPPGQRKGFNWLACCGITCLVVVIVGGLVTFCSYTMFKPFWQMGMGMAKVSQTVETTDEATAVAAAVPVTTAELAGAPQNYSGQWLAVTGTLLPTPSGMGNASFTSGNFNSANTTPYLMSDNVMVMDMSKAPAVGTTGDTVTAYGQIYALDMAELEKIPYVGKSMVEEMKKSDPTLAASSKIVFVMAKKVELVGASGMQPPPALPGGDSAPPPGTAGDAVGAQGWNK